MSKFELAKTRLKDIISLNPLYSKAYFNLGSIYMNVDKNYKDARKCFKLAIQLNPDYELAKENLEYINNIDEN